MNTNGMIEVTGIELAALVHAAYNPSRPQGLGHLHFQGGGLTDDEAAAIVSRFKDGRDGIVLSMDYVKGRSVKFHVKRKDGRLFIENRWYDHSDDELRSLLTQVGLNAGLVDKARSEQAAYDAKCIEEAVALLTASGGKLVASYDDMERLSKDAQHGLYAGKYTKPPRIAEDYKAGVSTWTIAA